MAGFDGPAEPSAALLHRAALCFLPLESQLCRVTSLPAAPLPPAHSLPITSFSYLLVFTAFLSVLSLRPVAVKVAAHQSHFGGLLKIPFALHNRSLAEERGGREKREGQRKEKPLSAKVHPQTKTGSVGGEGWCLTLWEGRGADIGALVLIF